MARAIFPFPISNRSYRRDDDAAGGKTRHRAAAQWLSARSQVSVQATALRPFFILGEVITSGSFAYQNGMTVQNAIAIAGGYSRAPIKDRC